MAEIELVYYATCIILTLLVIGEAIVLVIGMNISGSKGKEWLSFKNIIILIIDILTGLLVLFSIIIDFKKNLPIFIIILLIIICVSHFYREVEYMLKISSKFCINVPLIIFNSLKLILSLICLSIETYIQYGIK